LKKRLKENEKGQRKMDKRQAFNASKANSMHID
jgi:hypothetical protein